MPHPTTGFGTNTIRYGDEAQPRNERKNQTHISLELRAMLAAAASGPRELAAAASIAAAFAESIRIILSA